MSVPGVSSLEFDDFIAMESTPLLRLAVLLTGDRGRAEDLLQEALIATFLHLGRVRDVRALRAYVHRTMSRLVISWSRRLSSRERPHPADTFEGADPVSANPLSRVDDRSELFEILGRLPVRQRTVLVLRFYADLSEADIGAAMGCSVGTVKSQLHRARAAMTVTAEDDSSPASRGGGRDE